METCSPHAKKMRSGKLDKSEFGEKGGQEDDGGRCARILSGNVSGSEQEDALAKQTENHQQEQTEIKHEIQAVNRHPNEGAGEFQVSVLCQGEARV